AEGDHRPRIAEEPRPERERACRDDRGERGVARQREDEDPDARADRPDQRRDAEEGAAGRRDHLPAAPDAAEDRPPVPDNPLRAAATPAAVATAPRPPARGPDALRLSEARGRPPALRPVDAPDVRRADVAAPLRPDVLVAEDPAEPVPPRQRAAQVARN